MMKSKLLTLVLLLSVFLSTFGINGAYAQEPVCDPATGANCPPPTEAPTEPPSGGGEDNEDNSGGGGNPNPSTAPTATSTPVPTATPLPIALPESDYLGSCTSANFSECKDQFKCEDGLLVIEVDLYSGNGTKYDFYCIPHETVPTIDLPLTNPDGTGVTEDTNWTGGCFGDDVDACVEDLAALCESEGGDLSVWYDDGGAGAYCENSTPADSQPAPTEAPAAIAAAPTDDGSTEGSSWDEECGYWTCWMSSLSCLADGGSGYELDHASGAHIYHCDVPASEGQASPPSPWTPWITVGALAILIGLLLPAVQKVREAAARTRAESHAAKIDLINKDDGGTEASDYLLEIDGIKGESKQHIKKAKLFVRKQGTDQQDY